MAVGCGNRHEFMNRAVLERRTSQPTIKMKQKEVPTKELKFVSGHGSGQTAASYVKLNEKYQLLTCGGDGFACMRDASSLEVVGEKFAVSDGPINIAAVNPKAGMYAVCGGAQYAKVRQLLKLF